MKTPYSSTYVLQLGQMISLFFRINQTLYWLARLAWAVVRCRGKKFIRDMFPREEPDEELIREGQGPSTLSQKLLPINLNLFQKATGYIDPECAICLIKLKEDE